MDIVVPMVCGFSKQNISQLIHRRFFSVSITKIGLNKKKNGKQKSYNKNTWLGRNRPCLSLEQVNKKTQSPKHSYLNNSPGFILQIDSTFFGIESICEITSTSVDICYDTSYPFVFPYRKKQAPLDIIILLVNKLKNHKKKVKFIQVETYGALSRSS